MYQVLGLMPYSVTFKKKFQKKKKSIYIWEIEKCLLSSVFLRWKQETHCVVQVLNSQKSLHFNASSIDIIDVIQRACPLFLYLLTFFFLWCRLSAAQLVRNLVNAQQVAGSAQQQGDQSIRTRQSSECVSILPLNEFDRKRVIVSYLTLHNFSFWSLLHFISLL